MQSCKYQGADLRRCGAGPAPASTGYWASQGYCYTHAELLERGACGCVADRFYARDSGVRARASPPNSCGYCRARAAADR